MYVEGSCCITLTRRGLNMHSLQGRTYTIHILYIQYHHA